MRARVSHGRSLALQFDLRLNGDIAVVRNVAMWGSYALNVATHVGLKANAVSRLLGLVRRVAAFSHRGAHACSVTFGIGFGSYGPFLPHQPPTFSLVIPTWSWCYWEAIITTCQDCFSLLHYEVHTSQNKPFISFMCNLNPTKLICPVIYWNVYGGTVDDDNSSDTSENETALKCNTPESAIIIIPCGLRDSSGR